MIRRYYSGVQRGDEIINVRDSVLLKSGTRKKDPPFVARVSGLWEEDDGKNKVKTLLFVRRWLVPPPTPPTVYTLPFCRPATIVRVF